MIDNKAGGPRRRSEVCYSQPVQMMSESATNKKTRRWRRWWPLLLVFAGCSVCTTAGVAKLATLGQAESIPDDTVLSIDLRDELDSGGNPIAELFADKEPALWRLRRSLLRAAQDPRIDRVLVTYASLDEVGLGTIEHLRSIFLEFRKSEKPLDIFMEADSVGDRELYLGSSANSVTATSFQSISVNGLRSEIWFYRSLLDRLGVQAQVIRYKEYKSAVEPWIRDDMSPEMRESTSVLLQDLWQNLRSGLVEGRKLDPQALERATKQLSLDEAQASAIGMIDGGTSRARWLRETEQHIAKLEDYDADEESSVRHNGDEASTIALVAATGAIMVDEGGQMGQEESLSARRLAKDILQAAKDDAVAGIILHVDSPGGSVVASEMIASAVEDARTVYHKPVVAFMSSVAASGGYWISSPADAIVAAPSTITGSIGVLFARFDVQGLLDLVGVHPQHVGTHEHAGWQGASRSLTAQEVEQLEESIGTMYEAFVEHVAQGRHRSFGEIEPLAHGRVWSGTRALELGLVDALGGPELAIDMLCQKIDKKECTEFPVVFYPKADAFERILAALTGKPGPDDELLASLSERRLQTLVRTLAQPKMWLLAPTLEIHD